MQLRVVFGTLGALFVVGSLMAGPYGCLLLFTLLGGLSRSEFYGLLQKSGRFPQSTSGLLIGLGLHVILFGIAAGLLQPVWAFLLFPAVACLFIAQLFRRNHPDPQINIALTLMGLVYTDLPFALLYFAAFAPGAYCFQLILGSLVLLWASDSGAYFAGRSLGKTPLFPSVSPKKTWEGSIGGLVSSVGVSYVLSLVWPQLPALHWAALSVIMVVIGSYGDLSESQFKRSLAIKDSGSLIPGHGGLLDRFDGLFPAAPFVAAYLKLVVF